jgi:ribosomal-protein-alanine N-acetyltransferase
MPSIMSRSEPADDAAALYTRRLELRPLTLDAVVALLESRPRKEIEAIIGAELPWAWPSRALIDQAFPTSIDAIRADPATRLWGDRLMITRDASPKVVGSVLFHGRPAEDGVAEIAYGVEEESQGKGYGTEALSACIAWALARPECRVVRATTTSWHKASKLLLERVGLRLVGEHRDGSAEMLDYEIARGGPV